MGFQIIEGCVRRLWVPMDTTSTPTLYNGQLVKSTGDGVGPLAAASGVADTSGLQAIAGVVLGNNNKVPVYDSTVKTEKITSVITQADQVARNFMGVEGKYSKGDTQCFVEVGMIGPGTVLKAPIFGSATVHGTALTAQTVSTGSTTGLGYTADACNFTPVADLATSYCRQGANAGVYRISDDTSTTVETNDVAFPYDIAIGDKMVRAPLRPFGQSYIQINSTSGALGLWIDGTASPATNYFIVDVLELDLRESGNEHVIFTFHPCHFDKVRA